MVNRSAPPFIRYIGVDYSGAQTQSSSLRALRVYRADRDTDPVEVLPPPSSRKYWTRREVAELLVAELGKDVPTLVGIDHGFSFPIKSPQQSSVEKPKLHQGTNTL